MELTKEQSTFLPADFVLDNAKMRYNEKLLSQLLPTERFVYTQFVKKFSPCHFFKSTRMLVITTENMYHCKKD